MAEVVLVSIVGGIATVIGGLIVYYANRQLNKASAGSINADTIIKLSKRIDELEARDITKEIRIEDLERQVRRYARALDRAIRHIRQIDPGGELPDFLMDTGELKVKR
jgi:hypothetical protein